jgi:hypothetical protein
MAAKALHAVRGMEAQDATALGAPCSALVQTNFGQVLFRFESSIPLHELYGETWID